MLLWQERCCSSFRGFLKEQRIGVGQVLQQKRILEMRSSRFGEEKRRLLKLLRCLILLLRLLRLREVLLLLLLLPKCYGELLRRVHPSMMS